MVSKVERNRIIRLKRHANYLRSRYENGELTKKQRTQAMANANAMSWAVSMAITAIETREKQYIRHSLIDVGIRWLNRRKYWLLRDRYDSVEQMTRDLYVVDIMDHERTFDGQATQIEKYEAAKAQADSE